MTTLYIVSQFKAETKEGIAWEFQGVFDTGEAAKIACRDETYFYFPVTLNGTVSHKTIVSADAIYPKAEA